MADAAAAAAAAPLATVPEDQQAAAASSSTGLPPAAKAAAELAVKTAIAETLTGSEEGEVHENGTAEGANGDASGLRTVFSDPKNFNVVHPLYSKW